MTDDISVIITNYNHAQYLGKRFHSVLSQTADVREVLVVDDASTDDSWRVIEEWCANNPAWKPFRNDSCSGSPYKYWDEFIGEAKGEYIWIAESDDEAEPSFLLEMKEVMQSDPEISFVFCTSKFIDGEGNTLGIAQENLKLTPREDFQHPYVVDGHTEIRRHLSRENVVQNVSAVLLRKRKYVEAGGVDATFTLCADWDLWIRLCRVGRVGFLEKPLNKFRVHTGTLRMHMTSNAGNIVEALAVLDGVQGKKYDPDVKRYYGKLFKAAIRRHPRPKLLLKYCAYTLMR